ncbi:fungal-specific transcription factor domain-containing protein [Mycena floridula]|nr:fungal-specific transcription factor domain-containing protein [Mycena floridula]
MSSATASSENSGDDSKHESTSRNSGKKLKPRACDVCRQKRTKCDRQQLPGTVTNPNQKCSYCLLNQRPCTYIGEGPLANSRPKAYVTDLENRLERMEEVLKRWRPGTDYSHILGPHIAIGAWRHANEPGASTNQYPSSPFPAVRSTHLLFNSKSEKEDDAETELYDDGVGTGSSGFKLHGTDAQFLSRFYGRSSTANLALAMWGWASEIYPDKVTQAPRRPSFWSIPEWEVRHYAQDMDDTTLIQRVAMAYFPPPDLAISLFDLYFTRVDSILVPLLHRASVMRNWTDGLQYQNAWYAALCLAVFSMASRWSDDRRVLPFDEPNVQWTRAGWSFFNPAMYIHHLRSSLIHLPSLYEIQGLKILADFLSGTTNRPMSWLLVNAALRKIADVGAHQRSIYVSRTRPFIEQELWKRTFWSLAAGDLTMSAELGRAPGIKEEDFDLDLPLEVDQDHWDNEEDTSTVVKPHSGAGSTITVSRHWLTLNRITAFVLRTIYVYNTEDQFLNKFRPSKQDAVRQCSQAVSDWFDNIPLKWSEHKDDPVESSSQSAWLHLSYYLVEMLIYRPFIPLPSRVKQSTAYESITSIALSKCIDAARAAAGVLDHQMKRGYWYISNMIHISQVAAAILLIAVWDIKSRSPNDPIAFSHTIEELMVDINVFLRALESLEPRYEAVTPLLKQLRESLPTAKEGFINFYKTQESSQQFRQAGTPSDWRVPVYRRRNTTSSLQDALQIPTTTKVEEPQYSILDLAVAPSTTHSRLREEPSYKSLVWLHYKAEENYRE